MSKQKSIYLVAQYFKKPRDPKQSHVKGYMSNPENIRWDEKVDITRGLKNKDINCQVVINLSDKVVEKNTFGDNKDFDSMFEYFFTGYSQYITTVMAQLDPVYLEGIVRKMEADLQNEPQIVDAPAEVINEEAPAQ